MGDDSGKQSNASSGDKLATLAIGAAIGSGVTLLFGMFSKNRAANIAKTAQEEEAARQKAAENQSKQEATERVDNLMNEGMKLFKEGWKAEEESDEKEADAKFQSSYLKFNEVCISDPDNSQSMAWREVCGLKMKGNKLFNEGVALQERGTDLDDSTEYYKAARDKYEEASVTFKEGFNKSNYSGFQDSISCAEESMTAADQLLAETETLQSENQEVLNDVNRDGSRHLVGVIDSKNI